MASRKEQKEQARARRLAEEQALAERNQRTHRLRMLGGVLLGAAIVLAVAIAISSGSSSPSTTSHPTTPQQQQIDRQVNGLLAGIPQNGVVLGRASAPVTMTYYGDLGCPICRDFTLGGGFPQLVSHDVRDGKVKVVYRSFCTATCNGPGQQVFNNQQVAAYAAGKQKRFWNYTELFYHEQGPEGSYYANENYLKGLANQIPGLSIAKWQADRGNPALLGQVQADGTAATAAGVTGTPTLIMRGPKGAAAVPQGVPNYSELEQTINSVS
jgi:protein-disulfide isomerase